jgi:16S rRNA pseudouridine516 synthase
LIKDSRRHDLFPVGRLDKDTEGLLLLTNDGKLAHSLLSPKHHVAKVYYARVRGLMTSEDVKCFAEGLYVDETLTAMPAELEILALHPEEESDGADGLPAGISEIRLKIFEGKFHQVKRMVHAVGKEVVYLKRLSMGSLVLDETLNAGEYRLLTTSEREGLYAESHESRSL